MKGINARLSGSLVPILGLMLLTLGASGNSQAAPLSASAHMPAQQTSDLPEGNSSAHRGRMSRSGWRNMQSRSQIPISSIPPKAVGLVTRDNPYERVAANSRPCLRSR